MVKFPVDLQGKVAYNSSKQQSWDTEVYESASGRYRSLSNQLYPKWKISVLLQPLSDEEARALMGFVAERKGGYEPFLWKDAEDYHETGVTLARITSTKFQANAKFGTYVEPVEYIENVSVYVNGTKKAANTYTVADGYITFTSAQASSAVVTADFDYYWKVRFDDDGMGIEHIFDNINRSQRFKVVTAR